MPRRNRVYPLSHLTSLYVSKGITNFLIHHRSPFCKYCKNAAFLNENCYDLLSYKNILAELPQTSRDTLYHQNKKQLLEFLQLAGRYSKMRFEIDYLHNYIMESNELRIDYDSLQDMEDYVFITKFGKLISGITFWNRVNFSIDCFSQNLHCTSRLATISLFDSFVSDEMLSAIGRNCHVIREVYGETSAYDFRFTSAAYLKLIFKDPETRMVKNYCSSTLKVIDLKFPREFSIDLRSGNFTFRNLFDDKSAADETHRIVLSAVPGLKSVGSQFPMEDIISALDSTEDAETEIQDVYCFELTKDILKKAKVILPRLKSLNINVEKISVDVLRVLNSLESVSKLTVYGQGDYATLYDGILFSNWPNLRQMKLQQGASLAPIQREFNISIFAQMLPNLEVLSVGYFRDVNIIWDQKYYFNSLKRVYLNFNFFDRELNLSWFASFSSTIEDICFNTNRDVTIESANVLITQVFPRLEKIFIRDTLKCELEFIKGFFSNAPELRELGTLLFNEASHVTQWKELKEHLTLNNIDCHVDISYRNRV